jgi:hypothetical protein
MPPNAGKCAIIIDQAYGAYDTYTPLDKKLAQHSIDSYAFYAMVSLIWNLLDLESISFGAITNVFRVAGSLLDRLWRRAFRSTKI